MISVLYYLSLSICTLYHEFFVFQYIIFSKLVLFAFHVSSPIVANTREHPFSFLNIFVILQDLRERGKGVFPKIILALSL